MSAGRTSTPTSSESRTAGCRRRRLPWLRCLLHSSGLPFRLSRSVGAWKVFGKAGRPGWAVIVPIYNAIVLLKICGRPVWWLLLLMIPCVNIVFTLIVMIDLAKSFGKDALFGIGL